MIPNTADYAAPNSNRSKSSNKVKNVLFDQSGQKSPNPSYSKEKGPILEQQNPYFEQNENQNGGNNNSLEI